ncbi:MAG: helix-turn-helix domain-containing protein [Firmicutes bacterium]|nr:helix-turn-helix domain-containing protein [Bacillota bacterium]
MGEIQTAYWAVVPAPVRHDPELRPNAKLLYAEISALCDQRGYCWATNEALGEIFGISAKTVSALISQLEDREYLAVELVRTPKGQVKQRQIRLREMARAEPLPKNAEWVEPLPKNGDTYPQKCGVERLEKNVETPPIVLPRGRRAGSQPKKAPDHEPEMFDRFWRLYPRGEDKQGAMEEWDRLRPDRETMFAMSRALERQKASDEWQRGIGIPYAVRWLRKRRWEDEDKQPRNGGGKELPVWE